MKRYFEKTSNATKEIKRERRMLLIGIMVFLALFLTYMPMSDAYAASNRLEIYNYKTKKKAAYSDKQVKAMLGSKEVSNKARPGIIVDGIALLSYTDVFKNSSIQAECAFNKKTGSVTIAKYGTTIVMTVNSKMAKVNGKTVKLPTAPIKIKYGKAKTTSILVPSRFVTESLGLDYNWDSTKSTVTIKNNFPNLSYNGGKQFSYTGTKGQVMIDGKQVDLGSMPSILLNDTAMIRAKKVFADTMGAKYAYDKTSKSITLSTDKNVLKMTIGSMVGTLNGTEVKLDYAPVIVKNHDSKASFIMVPGKATVSSLGYNYSWNKSNKTSVITTKSSSITSTSTQADTRSTFKTMGAPVTSDTATVTSKGTVLNQWGEPATSDTAAVTSKGTVLNQWGARSDLYSKAANLHEINENNIAESSELGTITGVENSKGSQKNVETYAFTSSKPFGKVTSEIMNKVLTIQASNIYSYDQEYSLNPGVTSFVNRISTRYDANNLTSAIDMEYLPDDITYDISLSDDKKILYVTIYMNSLTSAMIESKDSKDYIRLTGTNPLHVKVTKQSSTSYSLDIPNTINGIGNQSVSVSDAKYLKQYTMTSLSDSTQIMIELKKGCEYTIGEEQNQFTITFYSGDKTDSETTTDPDDFISDYEIIIQKPEDVESSEITDEDDYHNNKFVIRMDGDYTDYFEAHPATVNSPIISDVSVSLNNSGQTELLFATSKLQGYKYTVDQKNIYVHIGDPKEIYKNIVVLDPGHGGTDPGAMRNNVKEKDLNMKILYAIGKKYFNCDSSKLKVYYTRTTDVKVPLSNRAAFASKVGADLFVSLHMNANEVTTPKGTEVYYSDRNNKANNAGLTSKTLASTFVNNLIEELGTNNRGFKANRLQVLSTNTVPAVLIELGFMSNQSDLQLITNETFQEEAAKTIYDTVNKIFESYPTYR